MWKNLAEALSTPAMDTLTMWQQVDPKAVSSDELCGWENVKTKEWRDGILSSMFRNMNKCWGKFTDKQKMKWCVFDGVAQDSYFPPKVLSMPTLCIGEICRCLAQLEAYISRDDIHRAAWGRFSCSTIGSGDGSKKDLRAT